MKKIFLGLSILILLIIFWQMSKNDNDDKGMPVIPQTEESVTKEDEVVTESKPVVPSNIKTEKFTGTLEEVNVGCFADGECYVVVDGKHVTTLVGRRQEAVGGIIGVDGFGDLEKFIGEEVEVLSVIDGETGFYTLYGHENLYVKLLKSGGTSTQINGLAEILGVSINPKSVLEDSRCPIDVTCIQAGTVRIEALIDYGNGSLPQTFTLGEALNTAVGEVTLVAVEPATDSATTLSPTDYVFYFKVSLK
jgi:uncharacterized protein YxeA